MNDGYLYSPWRLDYILSEKPGDCILCRYQDLGADADNLIVHRGNHCYVMLNRYPYNNGHIMLVPYQHLRNLRDLVPGVMFELAQLAQLSERVLQETYNCDGIDLGLNLGRAAGAGVDEHLHLHMVPRWLGDSNFMSVVSGQRVIPEAFELTYEKLRNAFQAAASHAE
ncbi:MAG TPA: HIT domain-containing protein [Candidatus Syntrophosphaera sp.]|nr:HIT domain-containing protein [Candidatus Syntrophosphaera sp.]